MRTADRKIPCVDFASHRERPPDGQWSGLPGMLVELVEGHGFALGLGADGDNMPGEIADQVAAGNPGRQGKALTGGVGVRYPAGDREAVGFRIRRVNGVANR